MNSPTVKTSTPSLGSVDGPTLFDWPGGPQDDKCGPEVAHVSPSRPPVKDLAKKTRVTSGQTFEDSSPSAVLIQYLANRLQANLDVNGSPEFVLIWKTWDMPSGPPICALRGRARRTLDNAFSGWLTAMAGSAGTGEYNPAGNTDSSRKTVELASSMTPTSRDHKDGASTLEKTPINGLLGRQVSLAAWGTPTAQDSKHATISPSEMARDASNLRIQVYMASGTDSPPLTVLTEKRGALNPAFSRWLQGYPVEWCEAAIWASRLMLTPRLNLA
jgi:hypothetical protein